MKFNRNDDDDEPKQRKQCEVERQAIDVQSIPTLRCNRISAEAIEN